MTKTPKPAKTDKVTEEPDPEQAPLGPVRSTTDIPPTPSEGTPHETAPLPPDAPPLPPGSPEFDQYYPGGVMKQMADLAGVDIQFNQNVPGGVVEQLRAATTPELELDQHGPGGPAGQIGYTIVSDGLVEGGGPTGATGPSGPSGPTAPTGMTGPEGGNLPGPQPRSAGVTAHDAITIVFDATLDSASTPYPEDFLVMVGALPDDVDTVTVTGDTVVLTFDDDLATAETAVSYTPSVAAPLRAKDGTPVQAFLNFPVAGAA